jgi:signal transduction histidine kinase
LQPKAVSQGFGAAPATALEEENLALHVAQAIVTAHGGVLEASSTTGQGTTFTVILPYA